MSITDQPGLASRPRQHIGFDPDFPGAPAFRYNDDRAKDRMPVVRYGAPLRLATGQRFTLGETWLINDDGYRGQDRYLLGTIMDDDARDHPIESRPSLVRLATALMYGVGILVESSVTAPVLAVVASLPRPQPAEPRARLMVTHLGKTRPEHPRAKSGYRGAIERVKAAVDPHTVSQQTASLRQAAQAMVVTMLEEDSSMLPGDRAVARLLGVEGHPLRDYEHAGRAVDHLQTRWSDKDIRRYLTLYGFVNASGNIGVWNHANLQRLRHGA